MRRLLLALLLALAAPYALAQTKISALPAATPAAADTLPAVHSGTTSKETLTDILQTSTAAQTWNEANGVSLWNFGNVSTPTAVGGKYNVGYAVQANIGSLSPAFGSGSQSLNAFAAQNSNAGGWGAITLQNDQYTGGSLATVPNYNTCCNVPIGVGQASILFFGSTVTAGQVISSQPAGESLWSGTINNTPNCIGTFQHCIMLFEGNAGTVRFWPTSYGGQSDPALWVRNGDGGNGTYALRVQATTSAGVSNGELITAGTNSSDFAFHVQAANATTDLFYILGDGEIYPRNPSPSGGFGSYNIAQSYVQGGYSTTGTGFASDPQNFGSQAAQSGPIGCITFNAQTATSNATTFVITLPGAQLVGSGAGPIVLEDNGTALMGSWVKSGTTITFSAGLVPGVAFTPTGTKGIPAAATICFHDN